MLIKTPLASYYRADTSPQKLGTSLGLPNTVKNRSTARKEMQEKPTT